MISPIASRFEKALLQLVALFILGGVQASDPVFLALLKADIDLTTAFPGEVIEMLWQRAEMRVRRCHVGASDSAWIQRVNAIADDPAEARAIAVAGREYLHHSALETLSDAGLDAVLFAAFRDRAERIEDGAVDFGSCPGFISVLQQIYDQPRPGQATPAVVGTVCGQVQALADCHGALPDPTVTLPDGGTARDP